MTSIRKNAGRDSKELQRFAEEYVIDQTLNESELPEFLQHISQEVISSADLEKADSVTEAAAKLISKVTNKSFEQLRVNMHKCLEKPGVITSGYYLKQDFDAWEDNLTEVRYSDLVTDEP